MWMRLLNPNGVDVEVVHADEGRHLLRVSRVVDRTPDFVAWHTISDEVELVPPRLGANDAVTLAVDTHLLYAHIDRAPTVGDWRGATTDEVLHASEGAG